MKKCTKCGEEKELSEFYRQRSKIGYRAACKECTLKQEREKYCSGSEALEKKYKQQRLALADPLKWSQKQLTARKCHLKRTYGMSLEDFDKKLESQEHCCSICHEHMENVRFKQLVVDHCHTTGKIRGLLCDACNTAIGQFKENKQTLQNAIAYLDKHDNS